MTIRARIGVSACFFHADPKRNLFKGKTLLYAEESMLRWVMSAGAVPVLLPRAGGALSPEDLLDGIDGLVLQGGSDMSPRSYGEEPVRPEWAGDAERDRYEIDLVRLCLGRGLPLLGVCRGAQVLNVALGGTLWQDIETQHPGRRVHRNWDIYDQHGHEIAFEPGAWLARWYAAAPRPARVNSVHHQGLKEIGRGLRVEARSIPDGVIEAVRYEADGAGARRPFAYGVQWHPEFMAEAPDPAPPGQLDPRVLLEALLAEVEGARRP